jgi:predicted transcriptional regulator
MSSYDEEEDRVSYGIIYRILNHIEGKGKSLKTRILYASNLNTRSLEKYLRFLLENNLISEVCVSGRRYYVLTPKGREFLYKLRRIRRDLDGRFAKGLIDLVRRELGRQATNTRETSKKKLHVVLIDNSSTAREAALELVLSYASARMDGEEVLGVIPSRLHDKILEIFNLLRDIDSVRLYTYNEHEDIKDLALKIVNALRSLETQYTIIV